MPAYKLKSLLYLIAFVFCAWVYHQADAQSSEPQNKPVAGMSVSQTHSQAAVATGI